jgi:predicted N-acetyltransferase YhbS
MDAQTGSNAITVRGFTAADIDACAAIGFEAHTAVSRRHGFPSEQPSIEFSRRLLKMKVEDPNARGFVAEQEGRALGSVFLNAFPGSGISAVGPLTVAPAAPNGTGRRLLKQVLEDAAAQGAASVRLVQSPAHLGSLALYTKLGFDVREPLVLVSDAPVGATGAARLRPATAADVPACLDLAQALTRVARGHELEQAIAQNTAAVVESGGTITGYSTGIGLRGHAVARTNADMQVLISATPRLPGPGFFVPIRNTELLRWLLQGGAKMQWPANLMSLGSFSEARGAYLPSIAF